MTKQPEGFMISLRTAAVTSLALAVLLSGCGRSTRPGAAEDAKVAESPVAADAGADKAETVDEAGVSLSPEEITALGLSTAEARRARSSPETRGFATVMPHDAIAQAVADLRTATAGVHQSQSALERVTQLANTPGAMPAETREAAERQAALDQTALELAQQRLSATLGQDPPWKRSGGSSELQELATGRSRLIRVTLPVDALGDRLPASVRISRVNALPGGRSWQLQSIWRAPSDPAVSGVTFFALLNGGDIGEGERLLAWVPAGPAESGYFIPASAAVVTGGRFYCYVERKPGTFERLEFDPGRPLENGYFLKTGLATGEKIVVAGAGQLLARELNPSKEAD